MSLKSVIGTAQATHFIAFRIPAPTRLDIQGGRHERIRGFGAADAAAGEIF